MSDSGRSEQNSSSPSENDSYEENEITNESDEGEADAKNEESSKENADQWNTQGASLEYPNPLLDCLVLLSKYDPVTDSV
ncbi:hypothetical protein [Marinomonas sp.]|uniref:hypothetical protein n=1 Tax=Marinomonas sp. TaxID=1904862 RepID=UPI003BA9CEE4